MALASDSDGFLQGQPLDLGRGLDLWREVRADIGAIKDLLRRAAASDKAPEAAPEPRTQPPARPVAAQPAGKALSTDAFTRALDAVAGVVARTPAGAQAAPIAPAAPPARPLLAGADDARPDDTEAALSNDWLKQIAKEAGAQRTALVRGFDALRNALEDLTDATRWAKKDEGGGLLDKLPGIGKLAGAAKGALGKAGGAAKGLLGKAGKLLGKIPIKGAGILAPIMGAIGLASDFDAADADPTLTDRGRTVKKGEAVGKFGGTMAGSAAGAMAGAVLGPVGMLAGGLIGGAIGAWGGSKAGAAATDAVLAPEAPGAVAGPAPGRGVPETASETPPGATPEPRTQADRRESRSGATQTASDFVPPVTAPGGAVSPGEKHLLERIAHGEGTSDVKAKKHGFDSGYDVSYGFGKYSPKTDKPLSQMTLGEVKQYQAGMLANQKGNKLRSTAVGKYQFISGTLKETQKKLGLSDDTIYSPEVQDRMGMELLKGRGYAKWKAGPQSEDKDRAFQKELSKEWASVADPDTGKSYHKQHVGTTSTEIRSAMDIARSGGEPGSAGAVAQQAPAGATPAPTAQASAAQPSAIAPAQQPAGAQPVAATTPAPAQPAPGQAAPTLAAQQAAATPGAPDPAQVALAAPPGALAPAQPAQPAPGQATKSVIRRANQGATRNKDITPVLESRVHEAVRAVYGDGASAELYSGGQDAKGKGTRRTGSTRHDDGKAGDFYIKDAQGKQIKGDDLGKIGQYWTAKGYGGVGMEMRGGGIHLDQHTDRAKAWGYADKGGRYSPAQKAAIARGMQGELPELKMDPALAALPGAPPGASGIIAIGEPGGTPARPTVASSAPGAPSVPGAPALPSVAAAPAVTEGVSGHLGGGSLDYGGRKDDNTPVVGGVSQDVRDRRVAHIVTGGIGAAL